MNVLFISNASAEQCGVAEYGRTAVEALRAIGVQLTEWDGHYPAVYARGHELYPPNLADYDVVHFNWHPVTLNHYQATPPQPYTVFLHDLPPWSSCCLAPGARHLWASEPSDEAEELPYPAIPDAELDTPASVTTLGWSGVRGDGRGQIEALCREKGWVANCSETFLPTRAEIKRLSRSTLNVLWYSASGRGQSLALMTCAAARRPLLINDSTMFRSAHPYLQEIYRAGLSPAVPYFGPAIQAVLDDIVHRRARVPDRFLQEFSWTAAAHRMAARWRALCG